MNKVNSSQSFHTSRSRVKPSRISARKKLDRQVFSGTKKTILVVIIFSMLIVILALLLIYFENPERLVKQRLAGITADYYENYYYPNLIGNAKDDESLAEIMSRYVEPGFATISLRQLLLFDNERYAKTAEFIKEYCDENKTYIRIHPEEPFGKMNYRVNYVYSCDF